jgi:hypothetical protein
MKKSPSFAPGQNKAASRKTGLPSTPSAKTTDNSNSPVIPGPQPTAGWKLAAAISQPSSSPHPSAPGLTKFDIKIKAPNVNYTAASSKAVPSVISTPSSLGDKTQVTTRSSTDMVVGHSRAPPQARPSSTVMAKGLKAGPASSPVTIPTLSQPRKRPLSPSQSTAGTKEQPKKVQRVGEPTPLGAQRKPMALQQPPASRTAQNPVQRAMAARQSQQSAPQNSPLKQEIVEDNDSGGNCIVVDSGPAIQRIALGKGTTVIKRTPARSVNSPKPTFPSFTRSRAPTTSETPPVKSVDAAPTLKTEATDLRQASSGRVSSSRLSATDTLVERSVLPDTPSELVLKKAAEDLRARLVATNNERHQERLQMAELRRQLERAKGANTAQAEQHKKAITAMRQDHKGEITSFREREKDHLATIKELTAENKVLKMPILGGLMESLGAELRDKIKVVVKTED